jgi:xylan 1,4-beta-xylosidase
MIRNPILPGFNPDPSICRVGADYYIATSTFEWYPGVQIHHSRDLVNWQLVARPLNRADLLDMRGNPDSCGVWAPCLSFADGLFWLVYTDVKRLDGAFKDAHNYITTCATIDGDWSPRVYVNSSGFDPSLFHDDDGRKWFLNMRWNHREPGSGLNPAHDRFDGIEAQEWHPVHGLTGPVHTIYTGTDLGLTEAPHLFKRNGWYHLTVAEGGTGYDHAVTMARSRSLTGPYQTHPAKAPDDHPLRPRKPAATRGPRAICGNPAGRALPHLPLRQAPARGALLPAGPRNRPCPLRMARRLALSGGRRHGAPAGGAAPAQRTPDTPLLRHFGGQPLPPEFQWLRTPEPDRLFTLTETGLQLHGRESLGSWFEQALVARRQEHHSYRAATEVSASPESWQQAIGLITYYNRHKFHAALLTVEGGSRALRLVSCLGDWPGEALTFTGTPVPVPVPDGPIRLEVRVQGTTQQFLWAAQGAPPTPLGPPLDASIITDEGGRGEHSSFTGAFVGMVAFDLTGQGRGGEFAWFEYVGDAR